MKKNIFYWLVLISLILSSCIEDPYVIEKLTNEEIKSVPYSINDSILMIDAFDSVLTFNVINDYSVEKTEKIYNDDGEYSTYTFNQRCVQIQNNTFGHSILFYILPNYRLNFEIDGLSYDLQMNKATKTNDTINNVLYKDVYTLVLNRFSGADHYPLPILIQYNKTYGLLYIELNNGEKLSLKKLCKTNRR